MGLIWEAFQELQLNKRSRQIGSTEERIAVLEEELDFVESLLAQLIPMVENVSKEQIEAQ